MRGVLPNSPTCASHSFQSRIRKRHFLPVRHGARALSRIRHDPSNDALPCYLRGAAPWPGDCRCGEVPGDRESCERNLECRQVSAIRNLKISRSQSRHGDHTRCASISEGTAVAKFQRSLRVCRNKGTPGLGNVRHSTNYILVRKFHSGL